MKFKLVLGAVALATAAMAPAQAAVVTFEGVAPGTLLFPGEGIVEAGYDVKSLYNASVIDGNAAFGAGVGLDLAGPKGNATKYYIGLNDASAVLTAVGGGTFRVRGFDFGFVAALTNLFNPGDKPGFMIAEFIDGNGAPGIASWEFDGADALGQFSFQTAGGLDQSVSRVEFYACTFNSAGCSAINANFSQFTLDNIAVPEPGSLALALLALGLTAGLRRRVA